MMSHLRWVRRLPITVLLALPLIFACASGPDPSMEDLASGEPGPDAAVQACVTGTVVSEGALIAPRTLLRQEGGEHVEMAGEFAGNVRRLTGAVVRACGSGHTSEGALEVTGVEVLEVDGMPALLGVLRAAGSAWMLDPLDGGDATTLASVPEGLQAAEGEVVWVAGVATPGSLTVRSFAVLEGWR